MASKHVAESLQASLGSQFAHVEALTRYISDEMLRLMGLSPRSKIQAVLRPVIWTPANRFARVAAAFDRKVSEEGLHEAARWVLTRFNAFLEVHGVENVPAEGPLLIASNHPGTVDGLAIAANITRPDLKIITTGIPFTRGLPSASRHLIYVPREGPSRMAVVRAAIRHLRDGGSVLIFPSGSVEPDPAVLAGASESMRHWSPSMALMVRAVPQTRVLLGIVSGVISEFSLRNPLAGLARERWQTLAEFFQVSVQMLFPHSVRLNPIVSFGRSFTLADEARREDPRSLAQRIIQRAQHLLREHVSRFG